MLPLNPRLQIRLDPPRAAQLLQRRQRDPKESHVRAHLAPHRAGAFDPRAAVFPRSIRAPRAHVVHERDGVWMERDRRGVLGVYRGLCFVPDGEEQDQEGYGE